MLSARLRQADGHAEVGLRLFDDRTSPVFATVPDGIEVQFTGERNGDMVQVLLPVFVKERNLEFAGSGEPVRHAGPSGFDDKLWNAPRGMLVRDLPPAAENDDLSDMVEQDKADNKVTFFFVNKDFICSFRPTESSPSLPNFQELRLQGALEVVRMSKNEALHGALLKHNAGVVSHRWETPHAPDPDGRQLAEIQKFLSEGCSQKMKLLWEDYCCIPQGKRTRAEDKYFRWIMKHMDFLYLGCDMVLALIDMSSQSRFWTQFEAWMAMQSCTSDGLHPASEGHRRCQLRCIHSAETDKDDKKMEGIWAKKTPSEAHALLSSRDVAVTNQSDKDMWLPLIFQLDEAVRDAFDTANAVQHIRAGVRVTELETTGFCDWALTAAAQDLLENGLNIQQLREAGFSAGQLRKAGLNLGQLREAGFSVGQLKEAGFNLMQLREAGFNAGQLQKAGLTAGQLRGAGFSVGQLREGGFNYGQLQEAGFNLGQLQKAGLTAGQLRSAGQLREEGFNAGQLREAGFDVTQLRGAGFNLVQLREAGFNAGQLQRAGLAAGRPCNAGQLREAGFNVGQLRGAGFNAGQLREAGFNLVQLLEAGFNARQLQIADFNAGQLREAGFNAGQLREAGFNVGQLLDAGFNARQLREAGFNVGQMGGAGFSVTQLLEAGFTYVQLQEAGF